jgi:fermentation-respiration switch protein FrsA (DUF1100 family)
MRLLWTIDLRHPAVETLRSNPVPTLVIHGEADTQVSVEAGRALAQAADSKLLGAHFLDGVEHLEAFKHDPGWWTATVCAALDAMVTEQEERAPE